MSKNWISQEIKQSSGKGFAEFVSFMFAIPYSPYIKIRKSSEMNTIMIFEA